MPDALYSTVWFFIRGRLVAHEGKCEKSGGECLKEAQMKHCDTLRLKNMTHFHLSMTHSDGSLISTLKNLLNLLTVQKTLARVLSIIHSRLSLLLRV
jgi:hypothetical protein